MKIFVQTAARCFAVRGGNIIYGQPHTHVWRRYLGMLLGTLALLLSIGLSESVQAAPLNLTPGRPDISALSLGLAFNASTHTLSVTGTAPNSFFAFIAPNGSTSAITNGSYSLTATISSTGVFSGGTFSIMGNGGTLLTGTLSAFGFTNSGNGVGVLEFTFNRLNSNAALGFGPTGGIILSSANLLPGNWNFASNFSGTASSDTFAPAATVPEPASIILLTIGGLGLAAKRRRQAKSSK